LFRQGIGILGEGHPWQHEPEHQGAETDYVSPR
jgi:hypothetical protein